MSNKLYELLTNTSNMAKDKGELLLNNLMQNNNTPTGGAAPVIEPVQVTEEDISFAPLKRDPYADKSGYRKSGRFASGEAPTNDELTLRQKAGKYLSDALLGKQAESTDNINIGDNSMNATISNNPRTGGLLRDFAGGFKENLTTPMSLENFGQNTLDDGRRKGFGYRAGEALGSIGRVLESPLGRGLLTAGIVGATGGSGLEALAYGGQAGLINQTSRMNDQVYRNSLNEQGIDTTGLRGYVNQDTYKNLSSTNTNYQKMLNAQSIAMAKDNTSRAKLIMDGVNKGYLTPEAASLMINQYGITDADFKESNETRKTDSQIKYTDAKIEDIKNPKPRVYISKKEGRTVVDVNHHSEGKPDPKKKTSGMPSPLGGGMVKIKAPNGKIKNIPASQVNAAIAAGGVRI